MTRFLIGTSFGSGWEGVDVAVVRVEGLGLSLTPVVAAALRWPFPSGARPGIGGPGASTADGVGPCAEAAVAAIRQALSQAGVSPREVFAVGLLEPARGALLGPWPEVADRLAERTGLTVVHGFRLRDRSAGGRGHPITALADALLFRSPVRDRLLIHLGAVTSVLALPRGARLADVVGFDAGPGNQLLDALVQCGSRGKETTDAGGRRAVQGRCLEPVLARWREHPYFARRPPKMVPPEAFGRPFLLAAFDAARRLGAGLSDLLCTATHLVARAVGETVRAWLPAGGPRDVLVSGGGVRNGFLWQLLAQQFPGEEPQRTDVAGVPALARHAAAAAVLAALTLDAVDGNLPLVTGAVGGRLLGQLVPGDGRNWARVAAWLAEHTTGWSRLGNAA